MVVYLVQIVTTFFIFERQFNCKLNSFEFDHGGSIVKLRNMFSKMAFRAVWHLIKLMRKILQRKVKYVTLSHIVDKGLTLLAHVLIPLISGTSSLKLQAI